MRPPPPGPAARIGVSSREAALVRRLSRVSIPADRASDEEPERDQDTEDESEEGEENGVEAAQHREDAEADLGGRRRGLLAGRDGAVLQCLAGLPGRDANPRPIGRRLLLASRRASACLRPWRRSSSSWRRGRRSFSVAGAFALPVPGLGLRASGSSSLRPSPAPVVPSARRASGFCFGASSSACRPPVSASALRSFGSSSSDLRRILVAMPTAFRHAFGGRFCDDPGRRRRRLAGAPCAGRSAAALSSALGSPTCSSPRLPADSAAVSPSVPSSGGGPRALRASGSFMATLQETCGASGAGAAPQDHPDGSRQAGETPETERAAPSRPP